MISTNYNHRLWKYAVIVADTKGNLYVKDGDHRCATEAEALDYAASQSTGKIRGLMAEDDVLGVWDMTAHAIKSDSRYDPTLTETNYLRGYDNYIRASMPLSRRREVNFRGQQSLELHPIPPEILKDPKWRSMLAFEWDQAHLKLQRGETDTILKEYDARPWCEIMRAKLSTIIKNNIKLRKSNKKLKRSLAKFLIAATTGAGKEVGTLAALLIIHELGVGSLFDKHTIHGAFATIPDTALELIEELGSVKGMLFKDNWYADFSKFKVYTTKSFYEGYFKKLTPKSKVWFRDNVIVVNAVTDIPPHDNDVVPVLLGSFVDIGLKSKLDEAGNIGARYTTLEKRLGILAIGEAHQFLSQDENKLWKQVTNLNAKFLLPITGTPQDFIYNQDRGSLFFDDSNRILFTRTQLYKLKKAGDPAYQKFPDINYYKLVLVDIIEKMKNDARWDELHGLTWEKLHTYNVELKKFKYEDVLISAYSRLLGAPDEFGEVDPVNIDSIDSSHLCDLAKRHKLVGLPTGRDGVSAEVYISALVKLIKPYLKNVEVLCAYDTDLSEIKETITADQRPTITFTCRKNMVGTNIPSWGTILMLRKLGDSVKFFEQSTGRVVRAYPGKFNAGVFIADLEAAINVAITVDQITNPEKGLSEIITENLGCYNFMTVRNGVWQAMDQPALQEALETLAHGGLWGISECIKDSNPPTNFDLNFKDAAGTLKENIILNSNGNQGAADRQTISKTSQPVLFAQIEKQKKSWRNMIKHHLACLRKLCYIKQLHSRAQAVKCVDQALRDNNTHILDIFGPGVEYFPQWVNDPDQIDFVKVDRWIDKIHVKGTIQQRLDMFADKELQDKSSSFYVAGELCARQIATKLLKTWKKKHKEGQPVLGDICAGTGQFLIAALDLKDEIGVDLLSKNCYYNDVNFGWAEVFRQLNNEFGLEIPDENITCDDSTTESFKRKFMKKFDLLLLNPPYQKDAPGEEDEASNEDPKSKNKQGDFWWKFVKPAFQDLLKSNGVIGSVNPAGVFGSGNFGKNSFKLDTVLDSVKITNVWATLNHYFTTVSIPIVGWIGIKDVNFASTTQVLFEDPTKNFEINVEKNNPLPFHITPASISVLKKCFFTGSKEDIMPFKEDIRSKNLTEDSYVVAINGGVYRDWNKIYVGRYGDCPHKSKATGAVIDANELPFYKSLVDSKLGLYLFYILGGLDKQSPTGILQRMLDHTKFDKTKSYSDTDFYKMFDITKDEQNDIKTELDVKFNK